MKITIDESNTITVELDNGHVQAFPPQQQEDCVKAAVQQEKAEGWEKRCEELEEENRNLMSEHFEMLQTIEELERRLRDAQDRTHEQDVTIAQYDDENRELKKECDGDVIQTIKWMKAAGYVGQSFNYWAKRIHDIAVAHGWWETEDGACDDGDRPLPEILMLCVTELSEAMEEYRNGMPLAYIVDQPMGQLEQQVTDIEAWPDNAKPEGIAVEMIDCIIRILDWLGHEGADVDALMARKCKYNESRPYRHGGKKA